MNNRRLLVVPVILLALVMVLFAQVATVAAVPPDREPLGASEPFEIEGCGFDVLLVDLTNTENFTTFYDQDGNVRRFLITGALQVELTNLSTGRSMKLNIPGPGVFVDQPDGTTHVTGMGPWLFFEHGSPDLPSLALVKGRTEFLIHLDGTLELLSLNGTVQDLCQVLAEL